MSLNELERAGLAAARERTTRTSQVDQANPAAWIEFGLSLLMESSRRVRAARLAPFDDVNFKGGWFSGNESRVCR